MLPRGKITKGIVDLSLGSSCVELGRARPGTIIFSDAQCRHSDLSYGAQEDDRSESKLTVMAFGD